MFAETEVVFRYSSLRAFLIVSAIICEVGGVILALLLSPDDAPIALALCGGAALFCAWGAYLVGAEVRVTKTGIGWKRGRRGIWIPWAQLDGVEQRSERLILRSQHSTITIDKQLDDYTQFYGLVRKYASPSVWKPLDFPLRCRARLGLPAFIVVFGLAWIAFIAWLAEYSPPRDDAELAILFGAAGFGAGLALLGAYLATFRCEFDLQEIRAGGLFRRKTYNVADLVEMNLPTESIEGLPVPRIVMTGALTMHSIRFRFKDGRQLKLQTQRISVDPEALYHLLAHYYPGTRRLGHR